VLPDDARCRPRSSPRRASRRRPVPQRLGRPDVRLLAGLQVYQHPQTASAPRESPNPDDHRDGHDEGAAEAALEFLRIDGSKRWFLYLHLMDVHEYLYDEDSALFGTDHVGIYDNAIRHTDSVIGVLLDYLREDGYLDQHAGRGRRRPRRGVRRARLRRARARGVPRDHRGPVHRLVPVPLEPGLVVDSRTRNVDIWPTLLELVGLSAAPGVDGRSRVPEILALARGETPPRLGSHAIAHSTRTGASPTCRPSDGRGVNDRPLRARRPGQRDASSDLRPPRRPGRAATTLRTAGALAPTCRRSRPVSRRRSRLGRLARRARSTSSS
jgi:hypothetical protein